MKQDSIREEVQSLIARERAIRRGDEIPNKLRAYYNLAEAADHLDAMIARTIVPETADHSIKEEE